MHRHWHSSLSNILFRVLSSHFLEQPEWSRRFHAHLHYTNETDKITARNERLILLRDFCYELLLRRVAANKAASFVYWRGLPLAKRIFTIPSAGCQALSCCC